MRRRRRGARAIDRHLARPAVDQRSVERPDRRQGHSHRRRCAARDRHGVDAVIVSNHGDVSSMVCGTTAQVLPEVVAAARGQIEVLMDGGIRRGSDIVKALCLGARAVLIGRAYAYGLGAAGGAGVARAIEILRADLDPDAQAARLPLHQRARHVLRRCSARLARRSVRKPIALDGRLALSRQQHPRSQGGGFVLGAPRSNQSTRRSSSRSGEVRNPTYPDAASPQRRDHARGGWRTSGRCAPQPARRWFERAGLRARES